MLFDQKIVLITGAGSGIGKATAEAYASQGATIIVSDINADSGTATSQALNESGATASFIQADVADYDSVQRLMKEAVEQYGRIDVAVNNAGIGNHKTLKTADADIEDWHRVMAVNATGVFYCMKAELNLMKEQGSGNIINISSIAGLRGLPNSLAYVASKHAVVGMTKTAAMEYARYNIRVNAVCPVFTVTPLFDPDQFEQLSPGLSKKLMSGIPMRRFAQANEMAEAILWLSSDKASFVTGHAMPVDGGLTA